MHAERPSRWEKVRTIIRRQEVMRPRGEHQRTRHAGIIRPLYVFGGLITGLLAKLVFFTLAPSGAATHRIAFAVGQVNGYAVLRCAPALRGTRLARWALLHE